MKETDKLYLIRDIDGIVARISRNMQLQPFMEHGLLIPDLFVTQPEEDNLLELDKTIARIENAINDKEIAILKNILSKTENLIRTYLIELVDLSTNRVSLHEYFEEREATKTSELNKMVSEAHNAAVNMGYVEEDKETTLRFYAADSAEFERTFFGKVDKEYKSIERFARSVNDIRRYLQLLVVSDEIKETKELLISKEQQKVIDYFVKIGWIDTNGWTNPKTGKQYKYKWIREKGYATYFLDVVFKDKPKKINDCYFGINNFTQNRASFGKQNNHEDVQKTIKDMIANALKQ